MSTPVHAPQRPGAAEGPFASLEAFLRQHRNASLAGAGVAVAGIAVLMRRRSSASSTSGVQDTASPTSYTTTGAAGAGGSGTYDSTSNDVYNSLQPQIEDLTNLITQLAAGGGTNPTPSDPSPIPPIPTPTPKPVPVPAPAPAKRTYVAKAGDTVWTVSKMFGISATQLLTLNPSSPAHQTHAFRPGEVLRVQL